MSEARHKFPPQTTVIIPVVVRVVLLIQIIVALQALMHVQQHADPSKTIYGAVWVLAVEIPGQQHQVPSELSAPCFCFLVVIFFFFTQH